MLLELEVAVDHRAHHADVEAGEVGEGVHVVATQTEDAHVDRDHWRGGGG